MTIMQSDQIDKLAGALSKAQAAMHAAPKTASNPFFKSSYADLAQCWATIRKPLTDNGLSVTQTMDVLENGHPCLVTRLLHTSGQWIFGRLPLDVRKEGDPQATGSAITYARRYALAAIVGLSQSDDDGESANGRQHPVSGRAVTPAGRVKSAMHTQLGIDRSDVDTLDAVIQWVTQGHYSTYAEAIATDEDASSVVSDLIDRHNETGGDMSGWVELAQSRRRNRDGHAMDHEYAEVVG